jgi:AmmeMemoRadiSam system protein B/AmmeMemoRadiSam system protein A
MWRQLRVSLALASLLLGGCLAQGDKVREPAVAGAFYPADPAQLSQAVDGYLAQAASSKSDADEKVIGLVAPHAGYPYSGPIAAYAYSLIAGKDFERVIVIAPSHQQSFPGVSIFPGDEYRTPLGSVPVDKEFARKLAAFHPLLRLSGDGHTSRTLSGRGEHALEVQLPFLQRTLKNFKIVPIVMGDQRYETSRTLGVALSRLIKDNRTLLVASSDLSHYHPYDQAVSMDRKVADAIREWDYFSLSRNAERGAWEACGAGPIVAAMIASERLGANQARILKQANSGDTSGDKSAVVGYLAAGFFRDSTKETAQEFRLGEKEQAHLMEIVRNSVKAAVTNHSAWPSTDGGLAALAQDRGAFVTLTRGGRLRGCIGYVSPVKPLHETVRDVAAYAAIRDSRFLAVSPSELSQLEYEVSVLSPLRRVADVNQIEVGKHGLLIKKGDSEGILLPQVPTENHWDRLTFLQNLCLKAGLPQDAWKDEDADIFAFTAFVFGKER